MMAGDGSAGSSGRLADDHCQAAGDRRRAAPPDPRGEDRPARSRDRGRGTGCRARDRRPRRGRHRRRPSLPDLHRLSPDPTDRGPDRPHAPGPRRSDDRRDRPGIPRRGGHRRPTDRQGQADPDGGPGPIRGARRGRAGGPAGVGPGGHLPRLRRGLCGHVRRRLDCDLPSARMRCASAESSSASRQPSRRSTASWR